MFRPIKQLNDKEVGLVPPGVGSYIIYKARRPVYMGCGHVKDRLWRLLHGHGDSSLLMAGKGELTFEYVYIDSLKRVEQIAIKELGAGALMNCKRDPGTSTR
ncbi:MAG TPA: hypothetical protein VE398_16275 [Acidobacteriota bacterium]|nr:hypothetical protein [Acidobacteriota bacterium]